MTADSPLALTLLALAATWLLHGTLLLGSVALATRLCKSISPALEEGLWKGAILASFVSAVVAADVSPAARLVLGGGEVAQGPAAVERSAAFDGAAAADRASAPGRRLSLPAHGPRLRGEGGESTQATRSPEPALRHRPQDLELVPAVQRSQDAALHPSADRAAMPAPLSAPGELVLTGAVDTRSLSPRAAAAGSSATLSLLALGLVLALGVGLVTWVRRRLALVHALGVRTPVRDVRALSLLDGLRHRAGVRRAVRLTTSAALPGPVALAGREICIPPRALSTLDDGALTALLAHELAHVQRRDPVWRAALDAAVLLLPFQPLLRLARARLAATSELLCDDWAVRATGKPRTFARCLAEVAGWIARGPRPLAVAGMAHADSDLVSRVRRLGDGTRGDPPSAARRALLTAGMALPLLLVAPVVAAQESAGLLDRVMGVVRGLRLPAVADPAGALVVSSSAQSPAVAPVVPAEVRVRGSEVHYSGPLEARLEGGRLVGLELGAAHFDVLTEPDGVRLVAPEVDIHVSSLDLQRDEQGGRVVLTAGDAAKSLARHVRRANAATAHGAAAEGAAGGDPARHGPDGDGFAGDIPAADPFADQADARDEQAWLEWEADFEAWEQDFEAWEHDREHEWAEWESEAQAWEQQWEAETETWAAEWEQEALAWEQRWEQEWAERSEDDDAEEWEAQWEAEFEAWEAQWEAEAEAREVEWEQQWAEWEQGFETWESQWEDEWAQWDEESEAWDDEWEARWDEVEWEQQRADEDDWLEELEDLAELEALEAEFALHAEHAHHGDHGDHGDHGAADALAWDQLEAEYELALAELEQELSFVDQDFARALNALEQEYDMAEQEWERELDQSMAEMEHELSVAWDEIWSRELEQELAELEQELDQTLAELEEEYERALEQLDDEGDELEQWLDDWEWRYEEAEAEAEAAAEALETRAESRWIWHEQESERALDQLDREGDRHLDRSERSFEQAATRMEREHELAVLGFERRIDELDRWFERAAEALERSGGERDCDHGCERECSYGCTHPEPPAPSCAEPQEQPACPDAIEPAAPTAPERDDGVVRVAPATEGAAIG